MIIAQISDTHIAVPPVSGADREGDLARVIDDIHTRRKRPDLVIHTGDASNYGRPDEYAVLRRIMDTLDIPWIILPGNRDNRAHMRAAFGDLSWMPEGGDAPLDFALEDFDVRIAAFDSKGPRTNKGWADAERLSALSALLEAGSGRPTVLAMHHPPFAMRYAKDPHQFADWSHAERLADVVRRRACVKLLLTGHSHRLAESHIGNAPAFTMPSVATDLRKGEFRAALARHPAYMLYELDDAGELVHHELRIVD